DGDKEQCKQGYPRRYQLKSPAEAQPDPGGRWETPGRLIAQAFGCGGACERRLGGRVGAFSCRQMPTLASMAGLRILLDQLQLRSLPATTAISSPKQTTGCAPIYSIPTEITKSSRGSN